MKSNPIVATHSPITETHTLPSNGKLYGGISEITLRSMTTFEEKMRLAGGTFSKVISNILNACIISPENFDVAELTDFDTWFLLYKLRTITYGPVYRISVECPCGCKINTSVNLDELEVNYLVDEYAEPYEITLPVSNDVLGLKYLRTKEIDEIDVESKKILARSVDYIGDPSYLLSMEHRISTINGETPTKVDLKKYVSSMSGRDSAYFHHMLSKINVGLVNAVELECPKCGEVHTYALPFTSEFFRPSFDD